MTELKAIELVDMPKPDPDDSTHELEINLKYGFRWFLGQDFAKLREGFIPEDNREEMKKEDERKPLKEKLRPNAKEIQQEPKTPVMATCAKRGQEVEAFYIKAHQCERTD